MLNLLFRPSQSSSFIALLSSLCAVIYWLSFNSFVSGCTTTSDASLLFKARAHPVRFWKNNHSIIAIWSQTELPYKLKLIVFLLSSFGLGILLKDVSTNIYFIVSSFITWNNKSLTLLIHKILVYSHYINFWIIKC